MYFEFLVTITAVVKSKGLKLVVTKCELCRIELHVAPQITRRVFRTVDTNERSETVVGMHSEREGARLKDAERNTDVKPDVESGSLLAHCLIRQLSRCTDRTMAITDWLWISISARGKLTQCTGESSSLLA